jgi:hypothetical protein
VVGDGGDIVDTMADVVVVGPGETVGDAEAAEDVGSVAIDDDTVGDVSADDGRVPRSDVG